jgi:ERF superfamily protein
MSDTTSTQLVGTRETSLMEVISRAASDPNADADKMERLLGMYERITAQQAKMAYTSALAEMQPNLPVIDRKGRITVPAKAGFHEGHSTPYALWEDVNDAIRPVLHDYGFALSFRIGLADDGKITVTGVLSHREGHQEETTITLMHDSSGSKNAVQAVGSSTSYGKRYTAMALLNITSRAPMDKDDDGDAADPNFWITEEQVADLVALMEEVGAHRDKFCNFLKVDTLARLPKKRFQEAVKALEAKRKAAPKKDDPEIVL